MDNYDRAEFVRREEERKSNRDSQKMKKYCSDCGRQICSQIFDTSIQAPLPVIKGVASSVICSDCSKNYDSNGLLPTEEGYRGE